MHALKAWWSYSLDAEGVIRYRDVHDADLDKGVDGLLEEMKSKGTK
jgi:hypothetical protein